MHFPRNANLDGAFRYRVTPVFMNAQGELIGIPTARLSDKSGNVIYLIRPVNRAAPYIEEARKLGSSGANVPTKPANNPAAPPKQAGGKGTFGELTFGTGFEDSTGITGEASTFPPGIRKFLLT